MVVDIVTEIDIACPLPKVFQFVADPGNAPKWYVNLKSVEWETLPPVAEGAKIAFVATFLGRRLAYTYEVMELIPEEKVVMRTAEGHFPMETTYTWEAVSPDRTHMTLRNRGVPQGFSQIAAPLMQRAIRRANQKDLASLKQLLENLSCSPSHDKSNFE